MADGDIEPDEADGAPGTVFSADDSSGWHIAAPP
jgi:hypothetical protein